MLSGGIVLASGDAFSLEQEAGNGNTFSYTATADLIILNWGTEGASTVRLGTWVNSTSGVYPFLSASTATGNGWNKCVLKSGKTITMNNGGVDTYGIVIGGIEL